MGIEDIKKDILDEAKHEAKRLVNEAKREAKQILKDAEAQVQAREEELERELASTIGSLETRETASAGFLARKRILTRKKELLDEFFAQCLTQAAKLSPTVRTRHVKLLVERARKGFPVAVAYARKEDISAVKSLSANPIDIAGGVIVENDEGTQRIDLTYETFLEEIRHHELSLITSRLFGES